GALLGLFVDQVECLFTRGPPLGILGSIARCIPSQQTTLHTVQLRHFLAQFRLRCRSYMKLFFADVQARLYNLIEEQSGWDLVASSLVLVILLDVVDQTCVTKERAFEIRSGCFPRSGLDQLISKLIGA